jgi:hypothetical protein
VLGSAPRSRDFSRASREERLGFKFLHAVAKLISVAGDDRTYIDYIPSRSSPSSCETSSFRAVGSMDCAIAPRRVAGANVMLFTTQADVYDGSVAELDDDYGIRRAFYDRNICRTIRIAIAFSNWHPVITSASH